MFNKLKERFRKPITSDDIDRIEINRVAVERIAVGVDERTSEMLCNNQELLNKLQNGVGH